ncbi:sorting nexin-10A isoform X2 [Paralichthys olivaceus]|uniref:sorting nexin-10A isoform X2 n=1 Tax=Paralichthys olivaceus TaxID=8255 RepID=UPI003750EF38
MQPYLFQHHSFIPSVFYCAVTCSGGHSESVQLSPHQAELRPRSPRSGSLSSGGHRRGKVCEPIMDSMLENLSKTEFVSICVRDPMLHKDNLWHTHVDYEICLHTNSMCFRKKTSCVRRRYSEFVWLRHCLEQNALTIEVPKLPPWNPFFSLKNTEQVSQRMNGLQEFLENVLHTPLLLSDSRLHLFLQSDLRITKIERCALALRRQVWDEVWTLHRDIA